MTTAAPSRLHPVRLLTSWAGCGYSPVAPGTAGTLGGALILWFMWPWLESGWVLPLLAAILFAAGCAAADWLIAKKQGSSDPQEIVLDEVVGFMLTLWGAGLVLDSLSLTLSKPLLFAIAVVVFRFADIVKPWPVSLADRRVKGGLGVMLDDAVAALYAVALLWLAGEGWTLWIST